MTVNRLLIAALLVVAGCATTQTNFGDALGAAYLASDTVAVTARELCGNTVSVADGGECLDGAPITTTQMRGLRVAVGEALDTLDAARGAYQAGSTDIATERLRTAQALLRSLEATLVRLEQ